VNDQDHPARHPAIETAVLGTEAVLYDERSGMVHHLNASACAIWMLLDGRPVSDIVATLAQATGTAPGDIRRDVLQTIVELEAAGLLTG
jgi:PqqD family protein of HPr-rel-A system